MFFSGSWHIWYPPNWHFDPKDCANCYLTCIPTRMNNWPSQLPQQLLSSYVEVYYPNQIKLCFTYAALWLASPHVLYKHMLHQIIHIPYTIVQLNIFRNRPTRNELRVDRHGWCVKLIKTDSHNHAAICRVSCTYTQIATLVLTLLLINFSFHGCLCHVPHS